MASNDREVYQPGYRSPARFLIPACLVLMAVLICLGLWFFVQSQRSEYRVVDGDTIEVTEWFSTYKVRLIGIDSPEKYNVPLVECYANEATEHLIKLMGDNVKISGPDDSQDDVDKYGRKLRYIYTDDGLTNINQQMVADGYAYEYTYDNAYEFQTEFKKAEAAAREAQLGLWAKDTCSGERQKSESLNSETEIDDQAEAKEVKQDNDCDANYTGQCVPIASHDLDCNSVSGTVEVVGTDIHRFDRDGDGYGCEPEPAS